MKVYKPPRPPGGGGRGAIWISVGWSATANTDHTPNPGSGQKKVYCQKNTTPHTLQSTKTQKRKSANRRLLCVFYIKHRTEIVFTTWPGRPCPPGGAPATSAPGRPCPTS
eukprot:scaffold85339_cov86-Phaeocystis_antarctica.AAC.1